MSCLPTTPMTIAVAQSNEPQDPVGEHELQLTDAEKWWRDRYEMLERHGYRLRPRYRPGWVPSWLGTGKSPLDFEDSVYSRANRVLDAIRISDGTAVSLKRVRRGSQEPDIARFLSPGESNSVDPMNHCVPILDHFDDESLPHFTFLVMPVLRWFDDPPFFSVDEIVDFMRQTLEGLTYMHKRGVAHRDCSCLNIMLEATPMYLRGFHPAASVLDPSCQKLARYRRRRNSPGIKYYFIDFGISTQFSDNVEKDERLVTGIDGQDREVPELSEYLAYDPFPVDVFILGNVYRRKFLDIHSNISFLADLITSMTSHHPRRRPSAAEALDQFNSAVARQPQTRLHWGLKERNASRPQKLLSDIGSIMREGPRLLKEITWAKAGDNCMPVLSQSKKRQ